MSREIVNAYIKKLGLLPHPEGGYYKQTFKSTNNVKRMYSDEAIRPAGTSIYYLLAEHDFSAWHILKSDEVWLYHAGDPLLIHVIAPNGKLNQHILGNPLTIDNAQYQVTIPHGHWFSAELMHKDNTFTLVGCTVNPGFEFEDFALADRIELIKQYPQHEEIIARLTREESEEAVS